MPPHQHEEDTPMDTVIEPTKTRGTDGEPSPAEDWRDGGSDDHHGGRGVIRSVLPMLVGSVAVGIAAVAVIGVRLGRRRKSKMLLRRAADHAENARNTLVHAAAGLPERGKAAVRRVRR
jgi:hypothetical protein